MADAERGGCCAIRADADTVTSRRYLDDSLVLETTLRCSVGEARILDCFTMRQSDDERPHRQLLRVVEGIRGWLRLEFLAAIRFDYGEVKPWLRRRGVSAYSAIGGNDGMLVSSDVELERSDNHDRVASCGSDLGLFAEEYDPRRGEPLGNYPQGLSHLSHIAAAVALANPDLAAAPP